MEEEHLLRVRVEFDDRKMLSKSQRSDGLNRSWLLLNPQIATISDLASHLSRTFHLNRSCPNGILLSMDDFVIPPFESTGILKDTDIIRVRKKDAEHMDVLQIGDDSHYLQDEVLVKQNILSNDRLLAIKDFEEDSGHKSKNEEYLCAYTENGSPPLQKKKRKLSDIIQGSNTEASISDRKKKLKTSTSELIVTADQDEVTNKENEGIHLGHSFGSSHKRGRLNKKDALSNRDGRPDSVIASQLEDTAEKVTSPLHLEKRKKNLESSTKKLNVTTDHDEVTDEKLENIHLVQRLRSSRKRCSSNKNDELPNGHGGPNSFITSELEDNAGKVTGPVQKGKRKKKLKTSSKKLNVTPDQGKVTDKDDEDIHFGQSLFSHKRGSSNEKDELCNVDGRPDSAIASQLEDNAGKMTSALQIEKRNVQSEENGVGNTFKKVPSRNARRKKARRKWLSEMKSQKGQNIQNNMPQNIIPTESPEEPVADLNTTETEIVPVVVQPGQLQQNAIHTKSPEKLVADLNTQTDREIVPVVVRPGHIRFHPIDEEQIQRQPEERMDTLQWNGTTSKKKGQKWGREKTTSKWNDSNGYNDYSNGKAISGEIVSSSLANGSKEQSNGKAEAISEKAKAGSNNIQFEILFPLTRIPQVGDVLAYRLIELSSSWCPEVSSFRVGQVTSYNYLSTSIILVPLPEHPIFPDADMEGNDDKPQLNSSLYKEDGTLQIDYPQLLDVRLIKASDSEATTSDYPGQQVSTEEAPVNNCETALPIRNAEETVAQSTENRGTDGVTDWDQMKQALDEKKAELKKKQALDEKKNGLGESSRNQNTGGASWSYRALRRSALGPTLAYLRDQNGKETDEGN